MLTLLALFFVLPRVATAQEQQLLKLLNDELNKQVKYQFKSDRFADDTIRILQPFKISEDRILSVKIRQYQPHFNGYSEWLQEVLLDKILTVDKDMNVILRTEEDAVRSVSINYLPDEEPEIIESRNNLFFLYFFTPRNNRALGTRIQRAFATIGINIEVEFWAD